MADDTHGTSGGVTLTDELIAELAQDAERGLDDARLTPRRRGRPTLGQAPATVFQVRLQPSLRTELDRAATDAGTTPSEIVRRALREYLDEHPMPRDREAS
jgi:CRISPR-associated endonuclease/helicase Cas3